MARHCMEALHAAVARYPLAGAYWSPTLNANNAFRMGHPASARRGILVSHSFAVMLRMNGARGVNAGVTRQYNKSEWNTSLLCSQ